MRQTLHRALVLSAALSGFAAFAAPAVYAAQQPKSLHDCGTEVRDGAGTGWCSGTGTFRVKVNCADGQSQLSGRAIIKEGFVQMSVACTNSAATGAEIVVLDNPPR